MPVKTMPIGKSLPHEVAGELKRNIGNPCVGQKLVTENDRVRVWMMHLKPGERVAPHHHVLDYIWVAVTAGKSRSYRTNGTGVYADESEVIPGSVAYTKYGKHEFKLHDLENIGTTDLIFTVVEFLDSANAPFPIPDGVHVNAPNALVKSTLVA
jgi:quercetin dioxygenase-like cupin family protein